MSFDYTTVIGVDESHIEKLRLVFPTWVAHKPSLLNHRLVIFYDINSNCHPLTISRIVHQHPDIDIYAWPPPGVAYDDIPSMGRFGGAQRYKMLAGFVHCPRFRVETDYWLKLDLDTVATGQDNWIDEKWFEDKPAIVAHPWNYTKPPDQMITLDLWASQCHHIAQLENTQPLNLRPEPGSSMVSHKRIISWCGFFNTDFTADCSRAAEATCGIGKLPVPSQDGYMWYMAQRRGLPIRRENMKKCGWAHCGSERSICDERAKQGISRDVIDFQSNWPGEVSA